MEHMTLIYPCPNASKINLRLQNLLLWNPQQVSKYMGQSLQTSVDSRESCGEENNWYHFVIPDFTSMQLSTLN